MTPRVVIEFEYLPSWNDLFRVARYKFGISKLIRDWLLVGERKACTFARSNGIETEKWHELVNAGKDKDGLKKTKPFERERLKTILLTGKLRLELHVWRPDEREYDVHNVFLKPVIDGMREARLFRTDSVKQVPEVRQIYEGIDRTLAPTKAERAQRKADIAKAKEANKRVKTAPMRARYRLEFYEVEGPMGAAPLFDCQDNRSWR